MPLKQKIVLHWTSGDEKKLGAFVEQCIQDKVKFIGVVGQNCAHIEDVIDELVVNDGSDDGRFVLTSSHPNETLDEALQFADLLTDEYAGEIQIVEL